MLRSGYSYPREPAVAVLEWMHRQEAHDEGADDEQWMIPYSSLERIVEENKDDYYRTLRRAQSTLDKDESRLGEWLLFFLRCLLKQKDVLARKMERERLMAARSPLTEQLLQLIREHGRLTMTAAVKLTGANRNTIKVHLRQLVEAGELRLQGQGRGSWYELA